jgi:magnesium transporter
MVSVERVLLYLSANFKRAKKAASGFAPEWRSSIRDVQAIEEHATFLSSKLQFMLGATLGLVSIEQNKIIKLFSVVSVVLMPPTLVASIYGMNFKLMPELDWQLGYPMALVMMVVFAVLPYLFFRWKKWL